VSNITWLKVWRVGLLNHDALGKFEEGTKEVVPRFKIVGVRLRSVLTPDTYWIEWSLETRNKCKKNLELAWCVSGKRVTRKDLRLGKLKCLKTLAKTFQKTWCARQFY